MSDGEDFLYFNSIKNRKQKYLALSDVFAVAEGLRTQVFQRTTKSKGKGKSPIGGSQSTLEARCLSLVTAVRYRPPVYCRQGLIIVGAFVGGHAGLIQHCPKNQRQGHVYYMSIIHHLRALLSASRLPTRSPHIGTKDKAISVISAAPPAFCLPAPRCPSHSSLIVGRSLRHFSQSLHNSV